MSGPADRPTRRMRGFERASKLMQSRIRHAGESRGFAESRVLTHWAEIVGEDAARIARPVKVSYAQGGFGATLTVLTTGAQAPIVEMRKEELRARVNACYGYNAIARIRITQTAPQGFGDAAAEAGARADPPDPSVRQAAHRAAAPVSDPGLRAALEALAENVLSRNKATERQSS